MKNLILILSMLVATSVSSADHSEAVDVEVIESYTDQLFQHQNIYIGPQPQFEDFASIKSEGITAVINMRRPSEMDKLDFYEDYLLEKAGIKYYTLPIGGDEFKYTPAKLEQFAQYLEANDGKVLLHCGSGHRASQLWAAYLVKYKGKTPNQALEMVKDMGWWPMPMETLLNQKLSVTLVD
ncbi:MAG: sulfur transferase domain-containing protein [Marinicellaceae bacterium]